MWELTLIVGVQHDQDFNPELFALGSILLGIDLHLTIPFYF